jgi:hypothetical protein
MTFAIQFVNQYFLLLVPLVLLAVGALFLVHLRRSRRWWLVWGVCATLIVGTLLWLRSPPATITQFRRAGTENGETLNLQGPASDAVVSQVSEVFAPGTLADIRAAIGSSGSKPTLVELYTDFGLG